MAAAIPAAVGSIAGAVIGSKSNSQANQTQAKAAAEALAYQKQKDAQDQANYEKQQAALKAQWDAEQARRAPYRAAAEALLRQNGSRLGLSVPESQAPPTMPLGWSSNGTGTTAPTPRTLSSVAGLSQYGAPPVIAPQMSLSDVLNGGWSGRQ
jgi:hypothetical protein